MSPILILLVGMLIVLGGILVFRLHAFLALILAAFAVAALTPKKAVLENGLRSKGNIVDEELKLKGKVVKGEAMIFRNGEDGRLKLLGKEGEVELKPGDLRVHHSHVKDAESTSAKIFSKRVAEGFGDMCMKIGILIAMAAIVGKTLMDSGAAERIVLSLRRLCGEKRTPMAFTGGGFLLGIPVFFDTLFYLLMPLGKAMHVRTKRNYLLYVLTIVAGGTMAHSLVPPTPGPLMVADLFEVDLGIMILGGCIVGIFTVTAGYWFAHAANRMMDVPLRESAELSKEELEEMSNRNESDLPPLFISLLPILLPVFLLAGSTIVKAIFGEEPMPGWLEILVVFGGEKNIALTLAAAVGLILVWMRGKSKDQIAKSLQSALTGGGVIILITAAGGAFGYVLRQTGIAFVIQESMGQSSIALLPLAWLICIIIRTAQGSATVAMITTAGIIAPIVLAGGLPFHPVYIALAIGCGSKPIAWMNDSGFWVISKMSGLTEGEMLKTVTIMGIVMATVGLAVCMLGAWLLPLR